MQRQRTTQLIASLLLVLIEVHHGFRHPATFWWAGLAAGIGAGLILMALRAKRNTNFRLRY